MCAQTLSSLWLHVEVLDVCELLAKTWSSLLTMSVVKEVQPLNCAIVLKCISECIHACITNHVAIQVKQNQCSMLKFRWELTHFRVSNSTVPHTQRVKSIVKLTTRLASDFPSKREYFGPSTTTWRREGCLLTAVVREVIALRVCLLTRLTLAESLSSLTQSKYSSKSLMVELFLTAAVRIVRSVAVTWYRRTVLGNFSWSGNESTSPPQASCAQSKHTRRRSRRTS